MLYSKKIYRGVLKKILGFLLILLIFLTALYFYLYLAVDFKKVNKNLDLVESEFSMIDTSLKDFLLDNKEPIEKTIARHKVDQNLINNYYELTNKLDIDFQLDFYPDNKINFSYGKTKKNYDNYKVYQEIIGRGKKDFKTSSVNTGQNVLYMVRCQFKDGYVIIYVPAENITKKINEKVGGFYITDTYGKVIFNDMSLIEKNLNRLRKLDKDFIDRGRYIEEIGSYEDYQIHCIVERTMSNRDFFKLLFLFLFMCGAVLVILLYLLRDFLEESTAVIGRLNKQIDFVSEGKLDYIDIKTDDEINSIVRNINKLIDSQKILTEKNLNLKYANKYNEFKMLESQFNPHFLYNTLELISITMYIDPNISERLIQDLNEILRYSINDLSFIRFDEDILYIYKFLDIQKIKSEENFTYQINMDEESGKVLVPKLFLQPLLENSLKYASKHTSKIDLKIDIACDEKSLDIKIKDNGKAMSQKQIQNLNHYLDVESKKDYISMKHHGMVNSLNRLKTLYKEDVKMGFVEVDDGVLLEISIRL